MHIRTDGYIVTAWGRPWGPPCSAPPSDLIPLSNGAHDNNALRRCLRWVKDHSKDPTDTAIQFVAEDNVRYSILIDAMDAARSDITGELFPDMAIRSVNDKPDASP